MIQVSVAKEFDILKCLMYVRLAKLHVKDLIIDNPDVSDSIKNGIFRLTREIDVLERKFLNESNPDSVWFGTELDKKKVWDANTALELILRIGKEENNEVYEQLLSSIMDCLSAIFYAQVKRKTINLDKYTALFNMFCKELMLDTDHQPSRILFENGEIYLRATHEK